MTTEDLIELHFFDDVLTEREHKYSNKRQIVVDFLRFCKDEIAKKLKQLDIKTPKQRDLVSDATTAHTLNSKLELNHSNVVTAQFKHNLLYSTFARKDFKVSGAREFYDKFIACLGVDQQMNPYFIEWREKLNKEIAIFNGKLASDKPDGETASTGSQATGITGQQSKADSNKARVTEQQAKEKHRMSRLAGFYP